MVGDLYVYVPFSAISLPHSLEMDMYLTCVIGIKIGPALLLCSDDSILVSFTIIRVCLLCPHNSKK